MEKGEVFHSNEHLPSYYTASYSFPLPSSSSFDIHGIFSKSGDCVYALPPPLYFSFNKEKDTREKGIVAQCYHICMEKYCLARDDEDNFSIFLVVFMM